MNKKLIMIFGFPLGIFAGIRKFLREVAYYGFLRLKFPRARFGFGVTAEGNCSISDGVAIEYSTQLSNCQIGRFTCIGPRSHYMNCSIGSFCSFGPEILAGLGKHPVDFISTFPAFYSPRHSTSLISFVDEQKFVEIRDIIIGNDVWIGARVILLDGIKIGDGAIIAAGAIVTNDVPSYAVVGGVPAKVLKMRFTEDQINKLLSIKWWNKDISWLKENAKNFIDSSQFFNSIENKHS